MHPATTVQHLIRQREAQQRQVDALARDLRERLPDCVDFLTGLGARKVLLFGSLARGEFRTDSDVDLAVEGLPSEVYFRSEIEAILVNPEGALCDVLDLDTHHPTFMPPLAGHRGDLASARR